MSSVFGGVTCDHDSEDRNCVIVAQETIFNKQDHECSSRGDDDGPLCSSSCSSRMECPDSFNIFVRFPDDRSDSGVSSLRSSSGDERSGSRSSALSSFDEPQINSSLSLPSNRSPLLIGNTNFTIPTTNTTDSVRVWRDPNLLLESEPHVRHIQSVQHQSLLMSHQPTPAASGPPSTSAASLPAATLYPHGPPPPSLMSPHPLSHHSHIPPNIYAHSHHNSDLLWKPRYSIPTSHILFSQAGHHPEEIMERERVLHQDRDRIQHERLVMRERQNMDVREMEKLKERDKERAERDKQEKVDRERQEREREEKERQEQALHNHFEKSLRQAAHQQKREQWNPITGRPSQPQSRTVASSEEDRKRAEQDLHLREQRQLPTRQDPKDNRFFTNVQRTSSIPSKTEYPPPAHSRISTKSSDKTASILSSNPKGEFNMFGYPAYHPQNAFAFAHESKTKELHKSQTSGIVSKTGTSIERDMMTNQQPMMSEMKNSVIVKHEGKNPHHMESRVSMAHSPSPKLRTEMMNHYLPTVQPSKGNMYEYRSPTQSPHHQPHTSSPHHHLEPQNLGKTSHHRPSSGQLPSPHHQRQSPHAHTQPHQSPEVRYRSNSESQAMIYSAPNKGNYQFLASTTSGSGYTHSTTNVSNSKPKVSSPAPHHIYGKPSAGIVSGVPPVSRNHDGNTVQIQLGSKPPLSSSISPSPYQQVSQYHPPPPQPAPQLNCPPPAHRTSSTIDRPYDRMYSGVSVPGALSAKPLIMHGTSPPTATAAPLAVARSHSQYLTGISISPNLGSSSSVQTQPLDLGVSSNKHESTNLSPKRKSTTMVGTSSEIKKRRLEHPVVVSSPQLMFGISGQPQLARVSEASPLIASAATTITTVVNTAACVTSTASAMVQNPSSLTDILPDLSVTTVSVDSGIIRPASAELSQPALSVSLSSSPVPVTAITSSTISMSGTESPTTPVKVNIAPTNIDSEKSNSPGPNKSNNYPVRHLKKAWLQRHTGEDMEDTTGVVGSGSCETLPININTSIPNNSSKESSVSSLHSIGSMAVNSISKPKHFSNKSNNRKGVVKESSLNGHPNDASKGDDSSSSDPDRGRKSPPKRKPPKVKRKKGGGTNKKVVEEKKRKTSTPTAVSESGSDSDKDTGSEKDSDSGASTSVGSVKKGISNTIINKEPRKRGRRPKISKNDKGEESRTKKSKEEILPPRDPFRKPPIGQLKKTGESFLQDGPCFEVAPKLAKCRECRWTPNQRSKNMPNIFCRFYAFRRLRYTKNGQLAIAGFSDPHKDALEDDIKLWLPNPDSPPADLDLETSRFLLKQVGDHFCDLLVQEKDAHTEHMSEEKTVAWKRVVQGVREMCDVCETTLFNFHWACGKCGFVVCLDCYKSRKCGTIKVWGEPGKDRDDFSWLLCTNRQAHEQAKLMLTQIIAGDSLLKLGKMVHEMRELWNIEQFCACPMSKEMAQMSNNIASREIIRNILNDKFNGVKKEIKDEFDNKSIVNGVGVKDEKSSPLSWLADVALSNEDKKNEETSSEDEDNNFSTLRELLIRPSHKQNGSRAGSPTPNQTKNKKTSAKLDNLDEVISSVIEDNTPKTTETTVDVKSELKHFVRRYNWQTKGRTSLPIRIMTLTESKMLYPSVPHSWLCDGKLLRLSDPTHRENYKIFQDQWKRGQPVIVSDVSRFLHKELWNPDSFARDFGDDKNDLVNCMTGNLVPNQPMRKFWEGFDHFAKRLKDDRGNPMLLKLKDWPPGEDFAEMLPTRFSDLMKVLPLGEYTHRQGRLNLASRLPDCFVRPDLGPKMYNAYGSALHPNKGTTNLHLDISDAVNVMVYVGIPEDSDSKEHLKEAYRAIDEAGCDILTRRRVRDKGELPGALWHIYNARDADKIRDLLNKVVVEKGGRLEPHHDPIHDQSGYLDGPLRERLYKEYGVEGYAIVQCLGDAVFIPAGAPHQVRNLHNCIKVAEDFVSPENVSHCFHLTQEFRDLSDTHSNHEDKLQIKNIIYHAVKDSLSSLNSILQKHSVKLESVEHSSGSAGETCKPVQESSTETA